MFQNWLQFLIQSVVGKDPVELVNTLQPVFEEDALQRVTFRPMYLCGGSPDFFYFHIWTTEVIPYNALNSEFANFETPCIINLKNN
jgi:hypothetical protein